MSGHLCPCHDRTSGLTCLPSPKSTSQSCVIIQECCKRIHDKTLTRIFDIFKGKASFLLFFGQLDMHVGHIPVSGVTMTLFPLCSSLTPLPISVAPLFFSRVASESLFRFLQLLGIAKCFKINSCIWFSVRLHKQAYYHNQHRVLEQPQPRWNT